MISYGSYVPAEYGRMGNLEVTNCDIKLGGTRKLPFAFTEQGLAMLSGVLNSDRHRSEYFHYASFCSCPPIGLGSSGE